MQCLIVAAGKGLRLRQRGNSKPLVELAGKPLIQHVIENANAAGISDFVVVTGYEAEALESFLESLAWDRDLDITFVRNLEYERPNGLSVLAAKDHITSPFLLTMCDHWMEPEIYREMIRFGDQIREGEVCLATDTNLKNPYVDLEDVTRVKANGGFIQDIAKGLSDYNAFDTGLFTATSGLFEAIEESGKGQGDWSISGGMKILGAKTKALTHNVSGLVWIDVDSPEMYDLAESYLEGRTA